MNTPAAARSCPTGRALAGFLAVQLLLALLLFRDALWGGSLLAPLDIAPALLSEFKPLDPERAVPDNHYILDQLVYDLPLQRTIHAAVQRGEVPWWDPYTYGGRPLLADAHVNGTDPVRWLCYALLPFEPAYNWTRILHFVVAGTGMFLLLRRLGIASPLPFWLALAWEFAGCQVVKFGHPWVPASFAWYPWLWLAFHRAWETGSRRAVAGIALAIAAVFYAGNLQSHTYLPLFLGALVVGYGGGRPTGWAKALRSLAPGILLGILLAAPVLLNEIEFFRQNVRHTDVGVPTKPWLAAALSLGGMGHPWALGTFRTLDASKLAGQFALGFRLFAGTAVLGGALIATLGRDRKFGLPAPVRAGSLMCAAYFAVLATPLVNLLYPRAAGLAVIGLVVMGAHGLDRLRNDPRAWPRAGRLVVAWLLGITLATHALAYVVWPKAQERVAAMLAKRSSDSALGEAPALRASQLGRFPGEISFANPEALLAAAGWAMLAALLLRPAWRTKPLLWHAKLALNLAPLLLFASRYIPRHEMALWQKIQAGTPAQRQVASALAASGGRLWEPEPRMTQTLFPGALGHLLGVRTLRGYSALHPNALAELPDAIRDPLLARCGDAVYADARFTAATGGGRFLWGDGRTARPDFTQLGLGAFRLEFPTPQAGTLVWTDTQYPGWQVQVDGKEVALRSAPPCFATIAVPPGSRLIEFRYRPTYLTFGLLAMIAGIGGTAFCAAMPRRRSA